MVDIRSSSTTFEMVLETKCCHFRKSGKHKLMLSATFFFSQYGYSVIFPKDLGWFALAQRKNRTEGQHLDALRWS